MTVIRTASGRDVDLVDPDPATLSLRDIARHLSQVNRFGGASEFPVSVAQHSVLVARIAGDLLRQPVAEQLAALLHDGHEAYIGDITAPVRTRIGDRFIAGLVDRFDRAIGQAVGLAGFMDLRHTAARADRIAFASEWLAAMPGACPAAIDPAPWPVRFMHASRAEQEFLAAYRRLAVQVPGVRSGDEAW